MSTATSESEPGRLIAASCDFFDETGCEGTRIYWKGTPGRDVGRIENEEVAPARSFRCWLPFGVAWGEEREDSMRILDAAAKLGNGALPTTVIALDSPEALGMATSTSLSNPPIASLGP